MEGSPFSSYMYFLCIILVRVALLGDQCFGFSNHVNSQRWVTLQEGSIFMGSDYFHIDLKLYNGFEHAFYSEEYFAILWLQNHLNRFQNCQQF